MQIGSPENMIYVLIICGIPCLGYFLYCSEETSGRFSVVNCFHGAKNCFSVHFAIDHLIKKSVPGIFKKLGTVRM